MLPRLSENVAPESEMLPGRVPLSMDDATCAAVVIHDPDPAALTRFLANTFFSAVLMLAIDAVSAAAFALAELSKYLGTATTEMIAKMTITATSSINVKPRRNLFTMPTSQTSRLRESDSPIVQLPREPTHRAR